MDTQIKKIHQSALGIALMVVLSGLVLMSTIVVEFAYQAQIDYYSAVNKRNQLQAYQLALSGTQFAKLIIKYDKEVQQIVKKTKKDVYVPPLYDLIPVDTSILRSMAVVEDIVGEDTAGGGEPINESEQASSEENYQAINMEEAKSFLDFRGDFSVQIEEEEAKLNLNAFFTLSPKEPRYDRLKKTLYFLLLSKEFADMFEDPYRGARELAQNIADYIDRDEVYNEEEGQERGREASQLNQLQEMKNAKLLSLEELALVPGMTDIIMQKLKPYVTIYGKDERVLVCRAKEALVRAMVLAYTQNNPRMDPLNDTNQELLQKATEAVTDNCPDVNLAAQELDLVLNVKEGSSSSASPFASSRSISESDENTDENRRRNNSRNTQTNTFLDLVSEDRNVYQITSSGRVDETEVNILMVWDTASGSPLSWRQLLWKIN